MFTKRGREEKLQKWSAHKPTRKSEDSRHQRINLQHNFGWEKTKIVLPASVQYCICGRAMFCVCGDVCLCLVYSYRMNAFAKLKRNSAKQRRKQQVLEENWQTCTIRIQQPQGSILRCRCSRYAHWYKVV